MPSEAKGGSCPQRGFQTELYILSRWETGASHEDTECSESSAFLLESLETVLPQARHKDKPSSTPPYKGFPEKTGSLATQKSKLSLLLSLFSSFIACSLVHLSFCVHLFHSPKTVVLNNQSAVPKLLG